MASFDQDLSDSGSGSLPIFTEEERNFYSLSCLLIREGRAVVDWKFKQILGTIKAKPDEPIQLAAYLKLNQDKLRKHYPKTLNHSQWRILFPERTTFAQNTDDFDFTLLVLLFGTLLETDGPPTSNYDWRKMPKDHDKSWQASVVRLRDKRNKLYGHTVDPSISSDEYSTEFKVICSLLSNVDPKCKSRLERYRKMELKSVTELKRVQEEVRQLFHNDIRDFEAFGNRLVAVANDVNTIGIANDAGIKELSGKIDRSLKSANQSLESYQQLTKDVDKMWKQIRDHMHSSSKVHGLLSDLHENVSYILDNMKEMNQSFSSQAEAQKQIERKVDLMLQNRTVVNVGDTFQKLTTLKPLLENSSNKYFRVLLLTPPLQDSDCCELAHSLGGCPWDMILDLDCESKTVGHMFDATSQALSAVKDFTSRTFRETKDINENDRQAVARGAKSLYLMVLGCTLQKDANTDLRFRDPIKFTVNLLEDVLKKMPEKKKLVCFLVVSNSKTNVCIEKLVERIQDDCASHKMGSLYVVIELDEVDSSPNLEFVSDDTGDKCDKCRASANQLTTFFNDVFGNVTDAQYRIPGEKGPCNISQRQLNTIKSSMELYHADIGAVPFDVMELSPEEIDDRRREIKLRFLRGEPITPDALWVNDSLKVFVTRCEMKEILKQVRELIERIGIDRRSNKYLIRHDVSSGGTTCARYVLYSLRNEYPCMELKQIGENLYEEINQIFRQTNKVCVIYVDWTRISTGDIIRLQNRLAHIGIRYVILHTQRMMSATKFAESDVDGNSEDSNESLHINTIYHLKAQITSPTDKADFQSLYEISAKTNSNKTVFLFGLLAFCEKYEKLGEHLETFVADANESQKRALRLCCTMWNFANSCTREMLLLNLFKDDDNVPDDNLQNLLGIASDFLIVTETGVRPAVSQSKVVDLFSEKLQLDDFTNLINDIVIMIQRDDERDCSSELISRHLLAERNKMDDKYLSPWIKTLTTKAGTDVVERFLLQLLDLIQIDPYHPYIRKTYAQYLMFQCDPARPEDSLRQMKLALGLDENDHIEVVRTTDSELLSAYGNLCRKKLQIFEKQFERRFCTVDELLKTASNTTKEAIFVYQRAQQFAGNMSGMQHSLPYWAESFVLSTYAGLVLEHKCGKNHVVFDQFVIACDDDLLKGHYYMKRAMTALEELERLQDNGRILVSDDDKNITFNKITQAKFQLHRLRIDDVNRDVEKLIRNIHISRPIDIGFIVRLHSIRGRKYPVLRSWEDLDLPQLQFIYEEIDRRLASSPASRANYQSIIAAMIYIRNYARKTGNSKEELARYNFGYAKQCAVEWLKLSKRIGGYDIEAHFITGVLFLVSGVVGEDLQTILEGTKSLKKCEEICNKTPDDVHGLRKLRFAIGTGVGLEAVVPMDNKRYETIPYLYQFSGRLMKGKSKTVVARVGNIENAFEAHLHNSTELPPNSWEQECLLQFNILITKGGLVAVNVAQQILSIERSTPQTVNA